jgi:hypothetical protein
MRTSKFLAAVAAVSLLTAPAIAAGSASKLSLAGSDVRAGKVMTNASNQDGSETTGLFIAAGAVAAVVLAVVLISSGDDEEDLPTSP